MLPVRCTLLSSLVLLGATDAFAEPSRHVKASLLAEADAVVPGQPLTVGIRLQMDEGWHTYWRNPGDSGLPTRARWELPEGFAAGEFRWPYPIRFETGPLVSYGYERDVLLPVEIRVPVGPDARDGQLPLSLRMGRRRSLCRGCRRVDAAQPAHAAIRRLAELRLPRGVRRRARDRLRRVQRRRWQHTGTNGIPRGRRSRGHRAQSGLRRLQRHREPTLRAGRQRFNLDNQRFVGGVGWRQNEQTFDAASVVYDKDVVHLFYAWVEGVRRIPGEDVPAGDHEQDDTHLVNARFDVKGWGALTGYFYGIDNLDAPAFSTSTFQAKSNFLESVRLKRSDRTVKAYNNALETFLIMLAKQDFDVTALPVDELREDLISDFVTYINSLSPATESLYLQILKSFFEFLYAENLSPINTSQVRMLIRQRTRRLKAQSSEYPEDDITCVIDAMQMKSICPTSDPDYSNHLILRDMRDSALILTLADTGLRVEELCKLKVGDMRWVNNRAILVGRGKKQSLIRFSTRAINAVKSYLDLRSQLYVIPGTSLARSPLFARHDKGAGKKIKPVTSSTIRRIVADRAMEVLGPESAGVITPHTFMHYFVTTILRATGNLKLAQVLARHSNIQVTQRYAHLSDDELDKGYYEIFEKKGNCLAKMA